jgi:hypothetical protein
MWEASNPDALWLHGHEPLKVSSISPEALLDNHHSSGTPHPEARHSCSLI